MDIISIILTVFLTLLVLFGLPLPYIQIGKKVKKSYKWTIGVVGVLKEKLFINDDVVEHFNYCIEEFQNFIRSNYTPSFTYMYSEIRNKVKLSKMEEKHISDEIERLERDYSGITLIKKLNRKRIFRQTTTEFKNLVIDVSKMANGIVVIIKEKNLNRHILGEEFLNRYNLTAKEFNHYLRHFRSFLDRTHCYHSVEIEHYKLTDLLVPEELSF